MLETGISKYPSPVDKYGLLACWKNRQVPALLKPLIRILKEYKVQTILDCSQTDLYISVLKANGWQVSSIKESQGSAKYDAVICMENEFLCFKEQSNVAPALQILLEHTKEYGIAVFCVPDYDEIYCNDERRILPLLLGETIGEKRGSVIQYVYINSEGSLVVSDYIYHVEDLASKTIVVDWETIECRLIPYDAAHDYIIDAGGSFHSDYLFGKYHIYVFGRHDIEDYPEAKG